MTTDNKGFDIIVPVFNEGLNIIELIEYIKNSSNKILNIYICYDFEEDTTIHAIKNSKYKNDQNIILLKNYYKGPCEAVKTGFKNFSAEAVVVYTADDFNNGHLLDKMYNLFLKQYDIICPCRFMQGGIIKNCPIIKYLIVRIVSFVLYYFARVKTKDPTNGFRMFSKKLIDTTPVNSTQGFAYSIELLIKAKQQKLNIVELPSVWIERKDRKSTFKILKWSPTYLKWFCLAFFV